MITNRIGNTWNAVWFLCYYPVFSSCRLISDSHHLHTCTANYSTKYIFFKRNQCFLIPTITKLPKISSCELVVRDTTTAKKTIFLLRTYYHQSHWWWHCPLYQWQPCLQPYQWRSCLQPYQCFIYLLSIAVLYNIKAKIRKYLFLNTNCVKIISEQICLWISIFFLFNHYLKFSISCRVQLLINKLLKSNISPCNFANNTHKGFKVVYMLTLSQKWCIRAPNLIFWKNRLF